MTFDRMTVRRAMMQMTEPGHAADILGPFATVQREALKFGKHRHIPVEVIEIEGGARITRTLERQRSQHSYPQIAALQPGESVLLDVAPISHQRVRVAASQQGRKTGAAFRCIREADAIRVVRTDGASHIVLPTRASKYDLDRLATHDRIRFDVAPADQHKVRLAASFKAKQTGWKLKCSVQPDGTMLVYRTDATITVTPAPT